MCYNVSILESSKIKLTERYKSVISPYLFNQSKESEKIPSYYFISGFSHPELAIIKDDGIFLSEWGLIPGWAKDSSFQANTLNAVSETIYEKPSFKGSIPNKRCILPVSGFIEWRDINKIKYPYFIKLRGKEIFSLACIYDSWIDRSSGEQKNTFSIVTTAANPLMEKIHNVKKRMPLILTEDVEKLWLDPKLSKVEIESLMKPLSDSNMEAYTISQAANNVRNNRNVPEILNEVQYPELALFV